MRTRAWTCAESGAAGPARAVELVARVLGRAINREGLKERRDCWVCGQDGDSTAGRRPSALLLHSEMLCKDAAVGEDQGGNAGRSVVRSAPG